MIHPFNRGEIPEALARLLGKKGAFNVSIDDTVVPMVTIAELVNTPYLTRLGVPVARMAAATAVAAEYGHIVFVPGPTVALQFKTLFLVNETAASQLIAVRLFTNANINSAGLASATHFLDVAPADASIPERPSFSVAGTHTTNDLGKGSICTISLPANTSLVVPLPDPGFILYGNDPTGPGGLAVINNTVNDALRAGVIAREWPLPG